MPLLSKYPWWSFAIIDSDPSPRLSVWYLPFLAISCKRKSTTRNFPFCMCLPSFSRMFLRLIHIVACISTSSFYYWIVFHFMITILFLSTYQLWTVGYYEYRSNKHPHTCLCMEIFLFLSGTFLKSGTTGCMLFYV